MSLLDIVEQNCSDRAPVMNPTQEIPADKPISSRTARILNTAEIKTDEELDRRMEMKSRLVPTK